MSVSMQRSQTKGRPARAIPMFKSTKCTRSFQRKHVLQFGLEIVELEEKGNMPIVTGVCCMFCVYHGWDVKLTSCKCMLIDNIHISKAPFIKQHYLLHLKQHAETWEEYNELSIDDKKVYFDGKVKRANTMHMYIALTRRPSALLSLLIVDVIIKELFYPDDNQILVGIDEVDDEDEEDHHMNMEWIHKKVEKKIALKHNAMKLFKLDEDNEMYMIDMG